MNHKLDWPLDIRCLRFLGAILGSIILEKSHVCMFVFFNHGSWEHLQTRLRTFSPCRGINMPKRIYFYPAVGYTSLHRSESASAFSVSIVPFFVFFALKVSYERTTPWKINMEPINHQFRKENDLNQTSRELCSMLNFRGVNCWWKKSCTFFLFFFDEGGPPRGRFPSAEGPRSWLQAFVAGGVSRFFFFWDTSWQQGWEPDAVITRWWNFQHFLFSPRKLGKIPI